MYSHHSDFLYWPPCSYGHSSLADYSGNSVLCVILFYLRALPSVSLSGVFPLSLSPSLPLPPFPPLSLLPSLAVGGYKYYSHFTDEEPNLRGEVTQLVNGTVRTRSRFSTPEPMPWGRFWLIWSALCSWKRNSPGLRMTVGQSASTTQVPSQLPLALRGQQGFIYISRPLGSPFCQDKASRRSLKQCKILMWVSQGHQIDKCKSTHRGSKGDQWDHLRRSFHGLSSIHHCSPLSTTGT